MDGVYAIKLSCIPLKFGVLVEELVEVESSAGWVPFEQVDGGLLVVAVVIDEGYVNARVLYYCRYRLWSFYSMPLDCGAWVRDPADFTDFVKSKLVK